MLDGLFTDKKIKRNVQVLIVMVVILIIFEVVQGALSLSILKKIKTEVNPENLQTNVLQPTTVYREFPVTMVVPETFFPAPPPPGKK